MPRRGPLHLRSWGSHRGRSVPLIPGAGNHKACQCRYPKVQNAQYLGLVSIVVRDYDEALAFYVGKLGFSLIEDTYQPAQDERWHGGITRPSAVGVICWSADRKSVV